MFVQFEKGGGILEGTLLLVTALRLYFSELVQDFLELAGEPLRVQAEGGEGAVGVDDVRDLGGLGFWRERARLRGKECGSGARRCRRVPG